MIWPLRRRLSCGCVVDRRTLVVIVPCGGSGKAHKKGAKR